MFALHDVTCHPTVLCLSVCLSLTAYSIFRILLGASSISTLDADGIQAPSSVPLLVPPHTLVLGVLLVSSQGICMLKTFLLELSACQTAFLMFPLTLLPPPQMHAQTITLPRLISSLFQFLSWCCNSKPSLGPAVFATFSPVGSPEALIWPDVTPSHPFPVSLLFSSYPPFKYQLEKSLRIPFIAIWYSHGKCINCKSTA